MFPKVDYRDYLGTFDQTEMGFISQSPMIIYFCSPFILNLHLHFEARLQG